MKLMQTKHLEATIEQSDMFTDLIRSNFRQVYDVYFSATAIKNGDVDSKKPDNIEYAPIGLER
ncbi:hypothetical protein HY636_04775 [Candidatus Woesearchaeota archaeon]|nr:hypothetical protein [Candidatus Woesearchaeota archaeon]